jgi:hypothetical protein
LGLIASMAFQSTPKSLAHVARDKEGLLDLDDSVDRVIFEFVYSCFFFNLEMSR